MHTPSTSLQAVTENLMADEANRELLRAAELDDVEAQCKIGCLYAEALWYSDGGEYIKQANYNDVAAEAFKWLERSAQQGDAFAQCILALSCLREYPNSRGFDGQPPLLRDDPETAFKWMLAAAEQGEELAFEFMGDMYAFGIGGAPLDFLKSAKWYLLAHDTHSVTELLKRHTGQFSKEDETLLVDQIRKEAEECWSLQRALGNLYAHGLFWLGADPVEAVTWHSRAVVAQEAVWAEFPGKMGLSPEKWTTPSSFAFDAKDIEVFRGNAEICGARLQCHLGHFFEKGENNFENGVHVHVECDMAEAASWYELSAKQGDALAQFKIAFMYDQGQGVSQNDALAAKWYKSAAKQGHPIAQNNLGQMYESGRGLKQSTRLARRWYRAAIKQGHTMAPYNLGLHYLFGKGVKEDKKLSAKWFRVSSERGSMWGAVALAIVTGDQSNLIQAVENLFRQHKAVFLGRMEDCVSQLDEFRKRLDELVKRIPAPRNAPLWESSWDGSSDDRRHWWKKLSVTARIATTLRGILCLVDDERDEVEARACFDLAAKNGDQVAAYYLATLEWRNKAYDLALQHVQQRVHPTRQFSVAYSSDGPEDPGYYSNDFQEKLDLWFPELIQNIRESKTWEEQHQAQLKAAEKSHKETLSFLTHTLNNTLSTGPETVRTVIEILGSDLYDQGQEQYKAINNMASLYPVFLFVESLLKEFKLYVSNPEQLREKWDNDRSGDATVSLVMAMALRQSIARFVFSPNHLGQLKRLLPGQDKEAIKQVRKSFVEEMIPLEISVETAGKVFDWVKAHFGMLQVEIAADAEIRFSSNATRYMFFFAAFSELVYNALKYSDGARPIQLRWYRDGSDYCFTCVNSCPEGAGAQATQEGTNTGLFFIDKLMSMLRESGLSCIREDGECRASLRFDHNNFGERDT